MARDPNQNSILWLIVPPVIIAALLLTLFILGESLCAPDKCVTDADCGTNVDPCITPLCIPGAGGGTACNTAGCVGRRNDTDITCALPDLPTSGSGTSSAARTLGIAVLIITAIFIVILCIVAAGSNGGGGGVGARAESGGYDTPQSVSVPSRKPFRYHRVAEKHQ